MVPWRLYALSEFHLDLLERITEDLLDMHEKPFEKTKQKQKRLFLYCWNLQMDSGIQNENIQPANV